MEVKKYRGQGTGDAYDVTIVCESLPTRNGFCHRATLFVNDCQVAGHRVNYLNRTWEAYTYQTAMSCVIEDRLEELQAARLEEFKTERGYQRMTSKRKAEFEAWEGGASDVPMAEYTALDDVYAQIRRY